MKTQLKFDLQESQDDFSVVPLHDYRPDPMLMGDCYICGNTREAHEKFSKESAEIVAACDLVLNKLGKYLPVSTIDLIEIYKDIHKKKI